jgi:mannitol/fructose-specific phosphotransferase system IIA component (Ntr-type)
MEILIGMIALKYGVISQPIFVAIIFSALISSILLGPAMGFALRRRSKISIAEFFTRGSVIPNLKSDMRDQIIRELAEKCADHETTISAQEIYSAVMAREKTMGTAMEYGIAFPHARIKGLKKTCIFFGRSVSGADWNSPDGNPTHFIFLILTPENDYDAQIQVLSLIAKTITNPKTRERLMQLTDAGGIWYTLHEQFSLHHVVKNKHRAK